MEANDEALVSAVDCDEGEMEMQQQQHENEECGENQHQHSTTAAHVLDEQSLQQLMDSGSVGEDSIIAIVQNEHGEPQTVVLSRADAEALGIQFDTVERPSSSLQVCHEGGNEEEEMLLQGDGLQHQHPNGDEMQEDLEMLQGQNGVTEGDGNNQQQQQVALEEDQEDEVREAEQQSQLMDQESVQHISLTPPVIVNEATATTLSLPLSSVAADSNTTTMTRSLDAASLTRLGSTGGGTSKTTIVSRGSSSGTTTITLQEAAAATGVGSSSSSAASSSSSSSNDMLSNIIHSLFQSNANSSGNNMSTAAANELLNQNNSGNASVSIVPRMVGGKRKLCLRLPASTASALLAQTSSGGGGGSGSTFSVQGAGGILGSAASSSSGGIPKRIKIVIPPGSSISGVQAELQQQIKIQQQQQQRVMKVAMHSTAAANKTVTSAASPTITKSSAAAAISGPARFVVESSSDMSSPTASPSVSSIVTTMKSSPIAKSSASTKPFLASLFNASSTTTVTPVNSSNAQSAAAAAVKKSSSNLGSTENPIQLVQEGNSFRSLQPLTPDQLKHIASVLKQNKQAIQEGVKIGGGSSPVASPSSSSTSSSAAMDNKRRVVYDAATNTRIVYRVVTPGELTKGGGGGASPSGAGHLHSPKQSSAVGQKILTSSSPLSNKAAGANSSFAVATMTSTPTARGRGRGRGRPPGRPPRTSHYINQQQQLRKGQRGQVSSDSDDDDDDLADEDFRLPASHNSSLSHPGDMSREEREGRKKLLPRTRSGRVSKPPRHMVKDYKRLHHLDFAQPDLDDSDGGYSDYRVDAKAKCKSEVDGDEEDDVDDERSTGEDEDSAAALKPSVLGLRATASRSSLGGGSAPRKSSPIPTSPFHCTTCKKEYTTPNRLSRHLEQFPDHSSSIDLDASTVKTEATSPKKSTSNGNGKETANESLDGTVEDDDDVPLVQASSPVKAVTAGRGGRGGWRGGARGRGRGRGRGRPGRPPQPHSPALLSEKRKVKLAEALEMCGDDEVVDVAGPRLSAVMSTWEYVLLRVQQEEEGNSSAPLIPRILNEVTALVSKVSAMAARHLHVHQTSITDQSQSGQQQQQQQLEPYQLSNAQTARIIGLQCGTYFISKDDRKLLTTEQDACSAGISTDAAVDEEEAGRSIVADEAASMSTQVVAESTTIATTTPTVASTDVMLVKSDPGSLWEELEEASSHLTVSADDHLMTSGAVSAAARVGSIGTNGGGGSSNSLLLLSTGDGHVGPHSSSSSGGGGGDPLGGVGEDDDDELMQVENVDDIVNQAVEVSQTGGSQAPSPL